MNTQEKARKSFNFACKQASNCRHDKYQVSCNSCPELSGCDIQERLKKAKNKM
jgi:hypothetical protein